MNLDALLKPLARIGQLVDQGNNADAILKARDELLSLLNPSENGTPEASAELAAAAELLPEGKAPLLIRLWHETPDLVNVDSWSADQRTSFASLAIELQMAIAWHKAPQTRQELSQWCQNCAEVLRPIVVLERAAAYQLAGYFANESVRKGRTYANLLGLSEAAEAFGECRDTLVDEAFHRLCTAARKASAVSTSADLSEPTATVLPRNDAALAAGPLHNVGKVDLKGERFGRLHRQFMELSQDYPYLRYIAATGDKTCPEWPRVPSPLHSGNRHGLATKHWLEVAGKPLGSMSVPISGHQWLQVDGRLWDGAFYFDGPESYLADSNFETVQKHYRELQEAIEQFLILATQAAGFLGPLPPMHPALVHFPRDPDLAHRWLEALCEPVPTEPAGYLAFDVRRVPGDVFLASAILLERLQAADEQHVPETRQLVPLNINQLDLRPALVAAEAFLTERHKADERSKIEQEGAIHILGIARRRLGEALAPYQHPDGLIGDDVKVGVIKSLLTIACDAHADSGVERIEAIIAALRAILSPGLDGTQEKSPPPAAPAKQARNRRLKIVVDLGASSVTIDGKLFEISPHHAQMLNALHQATGRHVTGPDLQKLPGCQGKNIYREIRSLKEKVPPLEARLKSDGNRGYYLVR